uniref:Uncharacterized protein n=1 Tax=Glossina austeni TaxID=7395 RepID=A0A1A9VPY6_GLOAU
MPHKIKFQKICSQVIADITLAKAKVPWPNLDSNSNHFACKNLQAIAPPVGVPAIACNTCTTSVVGNIVTCDNKRFWSQASFSLSNIIEIGYIGYREDPFHWLCMFGLCSRCRCRRDLPTCSSIHGYFTVMITIIGFVVYGKEFCRLEGFL